MVITSFTNKKLARKVSKLLVNKSLAGCCQILGPIESHYIWQNRAEVTEEYLCFIKTTKEKYKKLEKVIKDNHPYQVPEIIVVNITGGHKPYLNWLKQSTT
jgi:periplasmic divalent cation tolerance protein